jgi:hypothetical protein
MGKILDYIEKAGNGKYQCYKTKKLSLDIADNDTIAYNYDDNTVVQATKSDFAETDRSRQSMVSLHCKNEIIRKLKYNFYGHNHISNNSIKFSNPFFN